VRELKRGYIEIYIVMLLTIILFIGTIVLDLSIDSIQTRNNLELKLQAQYYSESGINHAKKLLEIEKYPGNNKRYYLIIENGILRKCDYPVGDKYIQINIDCLIGSNYIKYKINSNTRLADFYSYASKDLLVIK